MKNVLCLYDVSTSLILITRNPTVSLTIMLVYSILLTSGENYRDLAVLCAGLITATTLKGQDRDISYWNTGWELFVLFLYHKSVTVGIITQLLMDVIITNDKDIFQQKTIIKLFMIPALYMFPHNSVEICLAIAALHGIQQYFKGKKINTE